MNWKKSEKKKLNNCLAGRSNDQKYSSISQSSVVWNGFAFCISHQSGQMTKSKLCIVLGVLAALISLVFTLNFYFLSHLSADQNGGAGGNAIDGSSSGHGRQSKSSYMHQVRKKLKTLKPNYLNRNPRFYGVRNHIWRNFEPKPYENVSSVWDISYWVSELCLCVCVWYFFLVSIPNSKLHNSHRIEKISVAK